jgi:sigma-E factor negative regulatory protein RseA
MRFGERALVGHNDKNIYAAICDRLDKEFPKDAQHYFHVTDESERKEPESANQANFYWKIAAGFASVSTVLVLGWQILGDSNDAKPSSRLAQAESGASTQVIRGMMRDPELDKLLEAHRLNAGISALQLPAGFMRNATFDKSTH